MMRGLKSCSPFLLVILLVCCLCCNFSEARLRVQRHPSAVVVGAVYCHTCFQHDISKGSHYISGATVAVECVQGSITRQGLYEEVKTDKKGNFKVNLPFSVSKDVRDIKGCRVKLVKSNEPYCAVASTSTSSGIHLKYTKRGQHIYSAGFLTFKPLKQPALCNQQSSNSLGDALPVVPNIPTLPMPDIPLIPTPPITNPLTPTIPLLPTVPLPPLPPLSEKAITYSKVENGLVSQPQGLFPPLIPPIISPPSSGLPIPDPLSPAPLLPNPLQPPPSPLIPNPFQPPTPPPGLLPTIPGIPALTPPTPSPSPVGIVPKLPPLPTIPLIPGIPVVPGLTPTAPSPPPPASLLPPLLPPAIPGLPPAKLKTLHP